MKKIKYIKMSNKRARKSIHDIHKGAKRLDKAGRDTKNNSLSLLKAQLINEIHHGH